MKVVWGLEAELKQLYFGERKWLPLPYHTDFTLAVVQCTDLNSCINSTTLILVTSGQILMGWGLGCVGKMSIHTSNCFASTQRITVVTRQPLGLGLLQPVASLHFRSVQFYSPNSTWRFTHNITGNAHGLWDGHYISL
jgi:hypothetical protein